MNLEEQTLAALAAIAVEHERRGNAHYQSWLRELHYIDELEKENRELKAEIQQLQDEITDLSAHLDDVLAGEEWEVADGA